MKKERKEPSKRIANPTVSQRRNEFLRERKDLVNLQSKMSQTSYQKVETTKIASAARKSHDYNPN
jgi:hypothetical protein